MALERALTSGFTWGARAYGAGGQLREEDPDSKLGKFLGSKKGIALATGIGLGKELLFGPSYAERQAQSMAQGLIPPNVRRNIETQLGKRFDALRRTQGADLARRGLANSTIAARQIGLTYDTEREALASAFADQSWQRQIAGLNALAQFDANRGSKLNEAISTIFLTQRMNAKREEDERKKKLSGRRPSDLPSVPAHITAGTTKIPGATSTMTTYHPSPTQNPDVQFPNTSASTEPPFLTGPIGGPGHRVELPPILNDEPGDVRIIHPGLPRQPDVPSPIGGPGHRVDLPPINAPEMPPHLKGFPTNPYYIPGIEDPNHPANQSIPQVEEPSWIDRVGQGVNNVLRRIGLSEAEPAQTTPSNFPGHRVDLPLIPDPNKRPKTFEENSLLVGHQPWFADIMQTEGGLNTGDPHGGSNYGVNQRTYMDWPDRPAGVEHIRDITPEIANQFYHWYFNRHDRYVENKNRSTWLNSIKANPGLSYMYYDAVVNTGFASYEILNNAMKKLSPNPELAAQIAMQNPELLADAFLKARVAYHKSKNKPELVKRANAVHEKVMQRISGGNQVGQLLPESPQPRRFPLGYNPNPFMGTGPTGVGSRPSFVGGIQTPMANMGGTGYNNFPSIG